MTDPVQVLAFYLPQYHPTAENDAWWGAGFTEWTNVTLGVSLFRGHEQPHLPADLGFYDLRVPEVRARQAELAAAAGIGGFIYYHYWFGGRRLLHEPFDAVLHSGEPDFPFALCWANENWTRIWDGGSDEVLIAQEHSEQDDIAHLDHLAAAFRDPRYVRVEGKPLYLVYRAELLPDALRTTQVWRERARQLGLGELHLVMVESFAVGEALPEELGFDGSVAWSPNWSTLGPSLRQQRVVRWARHLGLGEQAYRQHRVYRYPEVAQRACVADDELRYDAYPCVTPGWDNSVRRPQGGAVVLRDSTPAQYQQWLESAIARARRTLPSGRRLVFINAWNEWAEGNHLEPDQRHGDAYLAATAAALLPPDDQGSEPMIIAPEVGRTP